MLYGRCVQPQRRRLQRCVVMSYDNWNNLNLLLLEPINFKGISVYFTGIDPLLPLECFLYSVCGEYNVLGCLGCKYFFIRIFKLRFGQKLRTYTQNLPCF